MEDLYKKFKEEAQSALTLEEFESLVLFFPNLLVLASDGIIDEEETLYVKYLARFMSKRYSDNLNDENKNLEDIENNYLKDLDFLTSSIERLFEWEPLFIEELRKYVKNRPDAKDEIKEIMYLFADASDGVSDEEKDKIEEIMKNI